MFLKIFVCSLILICGLEASGFRMITCMSKCNKETAECNSKNYYSKCYYFCKLSPWFLTPRESKVKDPADANCSKEKTVDQNQTKIVSY